MDAKSVSRSKVQIQGHPRSGNNYLGALISINFYNNPHHAKFMNKRVHALYNKLDPDKRYFYIYRADWDAVAKSLWAMRSQFAFASDDPNFTFKDFLNTTYADMVVIHPNREPIQLNANERIVAHYGDKKRTPNREAATFAGKNFKPKEFWRFHINYWKALAEANDNILIVKYENLLKDFHKQMNRIAAHLDSPSQKKYNNFNHKVGWYVE